MVAEIGTIRNWEIFSGIVVISEVANETRFAEKDSGIVDADVKKVFDANPKKKGVISSNGVSVVEPILGARIRIRIAVEKDSRGVHGNLRRKAIGKIAKIDVFLWNVVAIFDRVNVYVFVSVSVYYFKKSI